MDEAGTQVSNREWFSFNNKAVKLVCETFRYKGFIVIFTVPKLEFIDKQVRTFFDYHIEAIKIDFKKKQNILKVKTHKYLPHLKKDVYPLFKMRDGRRVKFFRLNMPPKELMDRYEEVSVPFKEGLADDLYKEAKRMKYKKEQIEIKGIDKGELAAKLAAEIEAALARGEPHNVVKTIRTGDNKGQKGLKTNMIGAQLNLCGPTAQDVKARVTTILNAKGYGFV